MKRILCACLALAVLLAAAPYARAESPSADAQAAETTAADQAVETTAADQTLIAAAAPSAVLMDAATGMVLYEQDAHARLAPASVTKIMTLLLVFEALDAGRISWEDQVVASAAAAAKGGSQVYLEEGEAMSMSDMLKSVIVVSANDCACALAEHVAGSEAAFVEMMNQRAAELGMTDTHFVNCTGLDDGPDAAEHLTSAWDIALMSRELLKHDAVRDYTTIWMDTVRDGAFGLSNTNKLVRFYSGTTGLKTGFTAGAGYCLSASAQRDNMELIAVVMHCESSTDRFESAKSLLDWGFANYCLAAPSLEDTVLSVPVLLGTQAAISPILSDVTPMLLDKGMKSQLSQSVELVESVTAPVEALQVVGSVTLWAGDTVLGTVDLVAPDAVPKLSWFQMTVTILRRICTGA